jgi:outer membrane protein assembly factor BamB
MHRTPAHRLLGLAFCIAAATWASEARADWPHLGGNSARNGLTSAVGPATPTLRWSGASESLISWTPIVEGNRVFNVRQTVAQNPFEGPGDSVIHAFDLATGAPLWTYDFPWVPGNWTTSIHGAKNGRVYAGRAEGGVTYNSAIHCLDAATGKLLWVSDCDACAPGLYDGVVFTENGDLIAVAGFNIRRIDGDTGAVVWTAPYQFSISGSSGPALVGDSIYVHERGPNNTIRVGCFDATTGAKRYSSVPLAVFFTQTEVFAGSNGMVFFPVVPRISPETDRLYAYEDTGTGLELRWSAPCAAFGGEHGATADGGVVFVNYEGFLEIRDQLTGKLRATSSVPVAAVPTFLTSPHIVVDGDGKIFFGNGGFPGTVFSFDPDLTLRWSVEVPNLNAGGPVLAGDGTLLIAGVGNDFRAYYDPGCAAADLNCDGAVNAQDLAALLGAWGGSGAGDLDGNGTVGAPDLAILLSAWG